MTNSSKILQLVPIYIVNVTDVNVLVVELIRNNGVWRGFQKF